MGDILYLVLVLLVVAAVLYLSYRFSRYMSRQSLKMGGASYMRVVDRLPVGPDRFLMIVELQGKFYLVSTTASSVEILKELEDFTEPAEPAAAGGTFADSFKTVLGDYMKRKK